MRLSTALKLLAVLAVALAVGLVAAAKSMDFQRLKGVLADQVQAATGRSLTIAGPLELRLGLVPKVIATGVSLGNVPGGSRAEMAKVERIEAEVALLPLLKREIRVQRLVLTSVDILLETGRDGRGNWNLTPAAAGAAANAGKAGVPATRFTLRDVRIKNARLTWRDTAAGTAQTFTLHKLAVQPDPNAANQLAVQVVGNLDTRMLEATGRIGMPTTGKPAMVQVSGGFDGIQAMVEGTVADPMAARGLDLALALQGDELGKVVRLFRAPAEAPPALGPFKLAARLGDAHGALGLSDVELSAGRRDALLVTARGMVKDIAALGGLDLAVAVESDSLAGLSRLTGTDIPSMGPLKATGTLSGGGGHWKLADLKATLAGSDAAGELTLETAGHPRLAGKLSATSLALADFITPASKPGEKLAPKALKADGDGRLFSADPLGLAVLRGLDADLSLRANRLDVGDWRLGEAAAEVRLAGGRLTVKPLRAWAGGGSVDGEATLDASGSVPALALRAEGRGVEMGRMLKDAGIDALTGGRADLRLDLRGRGDSMRALMASASGEAVVSMGEGRLHNAALDWAGGDLLIQLVGVLNPFSRSEDATSVSCAAVRFVVKDGVATADRGIAAETAKLTVVGGGAVDLRDERLDIGVTPRAREGLGVSISSPLAGMTRLRGTFANPVLSLDELGTVRTAASVGVAVATSGLSLLGEALFDRATADATPCKTALGQAAATKPPAKAADKKAKKDKKTAPRLLDGTSGR
ncbi:MAG TPA: AsmA family protein [Magnetospirillum sp.]|nr:AsmA family protein [Magnetospirillum sp.]